MTYSSNRLPPLYRSSCVSAAASKSSGETKSAQARQPILSGDTGVKGLVGAMESLSLSDERKHKLKAKKPVLTKPYRSKRRRKSKPQGVYGGGLPASYPKNTYGQGRIDPGAKMDERESFFSIWGGPAGSA